MAQILTVAVFLIEIFALANRGGGPLLSHLFLTGVTFAAVCAGFIIKEKLRFRIGAAEIFFEGFFLFFLISLVVSKTPEFGLSELLLFANAGLLFLFIRSMAFSDTHLRIFSTGLISLATASAIIGWFAYTKTAFPRFSGSFFDFAAPHTAYGNDFANFLLLILPLAVAEVFRRHERFTTTLLSALSCAILFSGFLLSFSRGAWISFIVVSAVAAGWTIFFRRNTAGHFGFIARRLAAVFILTALLTSSLQYTRSQKFQTTPLLLKASFQADEGGASVTERIDFWKGAVRLIGENPLLGSGVLSFKFLYPEYQPEFGANWDHPHDIFLKIGVENGLIAAGFFALFLFGCFFAAARFLWKRARQGEPFHPTVPLSLGALGAFGHNLIDFNFIVSNFILFIVFLAIGVSRARPAEEKPLVSSRASIYLLRGLAVASFILLLLAFHEGYYNVDFKRGRASLASGDFSAAAVSLERAQNLFFQRDLLNYLADAYRGQHEKTRDAAWRTKEIEMLNSVRTSLDAAIPSRLAEIYIEDGQYPAAQNKALRAIQLDPQNNLKYYYQYLEVGRLSGPQTPSVDEKSRAYAEIRSTAAELVRQYAPILRGNRHTTVLTENPKYAVKLADLLGMENEQKELERIWFEESVKFAVKYGADTLKK